MFRICSVEVIRPSFELAKAVCAADAIAEGILDFIVFGNGQMVPAKEAALQTSARRHHVHCTTGHAHIAGFFEVLPCPLPEPVGDKTMTEINAPGWLNTLIQSARGGKFEHKFIWTTDTKLGSMLDSFPLSPYSIHDSCIAHQSFHCISPQCRSVT